MVEMLAAVAMLSALVCGLRWPGVLLAGCLFTYQAASLSGIGLIGEAYIIGAALIAIGRFARSGATFRFHALDGWLFALVVWAGISSSWAPFPDPAAIQRLILSVAGMYAVARFVSHDRDNLAAEFIIGCTAIGGSLALILASVDASMMRQAGRLAMEDTTAVGLAQPLPFIAVSAALLFLLSRLRWHQALGAVALGAVVYTSLLSGTRSVFLASAIALLVALPLILRRSPWRAGGKVAAGVIGLMVAVPLFFSEQIEPAIERLTMNFTGRGIDLSDASSVERLDAYWLATDMFYDKPIFGYGHGGFQSLSDVAYPHNMFLEAAAEMGLIGVMLTLGWLIALAAALLQIRRHHPFAGLVFLTLALVAVVQMQVSFTLFMARPLFMLTALAAAFAGVKRTHPKARPRRRRSSRPHPI